VRSVEELRAELDPRNLRGWGGVRRMLITYTAKALWQLTGFRKLDGTKETRDVEVFGGVGIAARPPDGAAAEAITVNVGDANAPAIVAIRDEATRQASAGDLEADETAVFNTKAIMHTKADGTVEIRGVPSILAPEPMIKGTTYRAAEDALIAALVTALGAVAAYAAAVAVLVPTTAPASTALGTAIATDLAAAVTAFESAAETYLARVGKVE